MIGHKPLILGVYFRGATFKKVVLYFTFKMNITWQKEKWEGSDFNSNKFETKIETGKKYSWRKYCKLS